MFSTTLVQQRMHLKAHDEAKDRLKALRDRPGHALCAADLEEFRASLANIVRFCTIRSLQEDERFLQSCLEQVDVESRIAFAMRHDGEHDLFTIEGTLISVQVSNFFHLASVAPLMDRWVALRARLNSQRLDLMNRLGFKHRIQSDELSKRRELGWRPSHVKCFRCGCALVSLTSPQCGCHPECDATGCLLGTTCDCQACKVWSQAQWSAWATLPPPSFESQGEGQPCRCLPTSWPNTRSLAQVACELCSAVNIGEQYGARCFSCKTELPYSKRDFGGKRESYTYFWSTNSSTSASSLTKPAPVDAAHWPCQLRVFDGLGVFTARQASNLDLECSFVFGSLSWKWRRPWSSVSRSSKDIAELSHLLEMRDDLKSLSPRWNEQNLLHADVNSLIRLREQVFSSEHPWLVVDFQPTISQLMYCREKLLVSLLWPEDAQPAPNRAVIFETQMRLGLFYSIEYIASRWNHLPRRARVYGDAPKLANAISNLGLEHAVQVSKDDAHCDVHVLTDPFSSSLLTAANVANWLEQQRPGTVLLACVLLFPAMSGNHSLGEITYEEAAGEKEGVICCVRGLEVVFKVPRNAWLVRGDSFFSEKSGRLVMVKECARFGDVRVFRFYLALDASLQLGKPLALLGMLGAIERRSASDKWLQAAAQMTRFVPQRLWRHGIIELFAIKGERIASKSEARQVLVQALDDKIALSTCLLSCAMRVADYLGDMSAVMEGLPQSAHLFRDVTSLERVRQSVFGELRVRFNVDVEQVLGQGNSNYRDAEEIESLKHSVDFILRRANDFPNSALLCRHAAVSIIANLVQESPQARRVRFRQQVPDSPALNQILPNGQWFLPVLEREYVNGIGDFDETLALRNFCFRCPHFPNYAAAPEVALRIRRSQLAKFTQTSPTWQEACMEVLLQ